MASSSIRDSVEHLTGAIAAVEVVKNFYSIDVECVAIGKRHDSHAVGHVALVDNEERVLLDVYVKPEAPVVSYLTPISGLTKDLLDAKGIPFKDAVEQLKQLLPCDAVLVGQNIKQDIEWLGLKRGKDYASELDLAEVYKAYSKKRDRYVYFPLGKLVKVLFGAEASAQMHNAVHDAKMSVRLYNNYKRLKGTATWQKTKNRLLNTRGDPTFRETTPIFEGVCMGNKRLCRCGAPIKW